MIDIKQDLVALLKTATSWDVYYSSFYKPGTLPAITYIELDNADLYNGDTVDYSTLRYEIKVYAGTMADMVSKSAAIDAAMKVEGWSRYMSMETSDEYGFIKVLRYVAIGYNEV